MIKPALISIILVLLSKVYGFSQPNWAEFIEQIPQQKLSSRIKVPKHFKIHPTSNQEVFKFFICHTSKLATQIMEDEERFAVDSTYAVNFLDNFDVNNTQKLSSELCTAEYCQQILCIEKYKINQNMIAILWLSKVNKGEIVNYSWHNGVDLWLLIYDKDNCISYQKIAFKYNLPFRKELKSKRISKIHTTKQSLILESKTIKAQLADKEQLFSTKKRVKVLKIKSTDKRIYKI